MHFGRTARWPVGTVLLAALAALTGGCMHHAAAVPVPPPGDVPRELAKATLPPYVVEPPDILVIEVREAQEPAADPMDPTKIRPPAAIPLNVQPIEGTHIVRPDGTVNLGIYGSVQVAGLSLDQAAQAIRYTVAQVKGYRPEKLLVVVDVASYNSKRYYVITDGAGYGEQVFPFPVTGSETVLDAIGNIQGLPAVSSKRNIWVARRGPGCGNPDQILPVDWVGITQHGDVTTNYQVLPGDRVYVKAQCILTLDNTLAKFLAPIERLFGITLLGSETVNSIKGRTGTTGTGG
jgi:polysaccharide export outer membrane protein